MGYGTYRLGVLSRAAPVPHPVVAIQTQGLMEPRPTPPVPAEASPAPRLHHVSPHLPLDPVPHEAKAPARVPDPEVVDPAPQNRVDLRDHPPDRLGPRAPKDLRELRPQPRPLLRLRRILRPPHAPTRTHAPKVKAQEVEALPLAPVHDPALGLVQAQIKLGELLPQPPVHRLQQPLVATEAIHEYHQVVGPARVLHVRVPPSPGGLLRPLQHPIHLREVDVAEQRRDDPSRTIANF